MWQTADVRAAGERYRRTLTIANGSYLAAAPLLSGDGDRAGTLFLYQGKPSWGLLTVTSAPGDGSYTVTVKERDGSLHLVGACAVTGRTADGEVVDPVHRDVEHTASCASWTRERARGWSPYP